MDRRSDYRDLLRRKLSERIDRNPRYSLRAYAKSFGLDPGTLSRILAGKHVPSPKAVEKIRNTLDLSPLESDVFLRSLEQAKKRKRVQTLRPLLEETEEAEKKHREFRELSIDLFRVIGDWYHVAILEQTLLDGFDATPRNIAARLGIPVVEAKLAIERLLSLGLLEQSGKRLRKTDTVCTTADKHLTNSALKRRQKQILEKSIQSLENIPIAERNHSAMTMAIDPSLLPEAKRRIEAFNESLCLFLESGKRKAVYELQVSLFPLEQNKKEKS